MTGHDFRFYSLSIKQALTLGLMQAGVEVVDIGLCLTPVAYFAQFALDVPAGTDGAVHLLAAAMNSSAERPTRVVRRDGIRFQGLRYVSPTLAGYVGRSVVIRYDPRDITEIRVFDHDEFVCKAVNQEHHDQKVSLKEIQAARNARRRALRAGINERIALVAAPTETPRITEAPTPAPRSALKIYKEDLR